MLILKLSGKCIVSIIFIKAQEHSDVLLSLHLVLLSLRSRSQFLFVRNLRSSLAVYPEFRQKKTKTDKTTDRTEVC